MMDVRCFSRQSIVENFARRYYFNEEVEIKQKLSRYSSNRQSLKDQRRVGTDQSTGYDSFAITKIAEYI